MVNMTTIIRLLLTIALIIWIYIDLQSVPLTIFVILHYITNEIQAYVINKMNK